MVSLNSIGGDQEDKVANDKGRARCQVVGENAKLVEHVKDPDEVPIDLAGVFLILIGPIVFAIEKPFDISANQFAAIADVVNDPVFNDRGRADPLLRPVIHAPLAELVMNRLPEELSIGSGEAHNIALVADDVRVPLALVVGADKHPSIGDAWVAIALRP